MDRNAKKVNNFFISLWFKINATKLEKKLIQYLGQKEKNGKKASSQSLKLPSIQVRKQACMYKCRAEINT